MSDTWRVIPPGYFQAAEWAEGYTSGQGSAGTVGGWPDQPLPRREFAPGFHGANPGPSQPEVKPRYRIKAGSRPA